MSELAPCTLKMSELAHHWSWLKMSKLAQMSDLAKNDSGFPLSNIPILSLRLRNWACLSNWFALRTWLSLSHRTCLTQRGRLQSKENSKWFLSLCRAFARCRSCKKSPLHEPVLKLTSNLIGAPVWIGDHSTSLPPPPSSSPLPPHRWLLSWLTRRWISWTAWRGAFDLNA